ncbi:MAG: flagellar type III secretion system protein FlhA [Planctomycetaceae bacterium]|nr:flagellar type III secretion system protein FlhA [Planctomycetaceae bacterium]
MQRIRWQDIIIPVGIIASILVLLIPVPTWLLDVFLACNITFAVIILLTTLNIKTSLELSVFPAILLSATLGRLVLNVASTRLILTGGATEGTQAAGHVISAFGEFVAGNDLIVGMVIFAILIVIQFVVLTKGATRVSEVAARFTLDGMLGRQQAINSDLNAGLITAKEAQQQRHDLTAQSDFYGAMDGASKFVRGDAIAAIIITGINIIVGLAYGVFKAGMPTHEAAEVFTYLTIGDGLVSQVPALLISLATAVLVTRTSQTDKLSHQLLSQLFNQPHVLVIAAAFLAILTLTSLPKLPLLSMAVACLGIAYVLSRKSSEDNAKSNEGAPEKSSASSEPADISQLLKVEPVLLSLGVRLLPLAQRNGNDGILQRIHQLRQQFAIQLGMVLPEIRIRDNLSLAANQYEISIHGHPIARGKLAVNRLLIVAKDKNAESDLSTDFPASVQAESTEHGSNARWIATSNKPQAVDLGYHPITPTDVLGIHLDDLLQQHAADLLDHEATAQLVNQLDAHTPQIVDEVIPKLISMAQLQQILQQLLTQNVSIRSLSAIFETIARHAPHESHPIILTERIRTRLGRAICHSFSDFQTASFISLCPQTELFIERAMRFTHTELDVDVSATFSHQLSRQIKRAERLNPQIVAVVTNPSIRAAVQQLAGQHGIRLPILTTTEIPSDLQIHAGPELSITSHMPQPAPLHEQLVS